MTITIGFWIVPVILTLAGFVHVSLRPPQGDWDIGGAFVGVIWLSIAVTSWVMWGLSWLM